MSDQRHAELETLSQLAVAEPSSSNANQPATISETPSSARAVIDTSTPSPPSPPSIHASADAPLDDLQTSTYPAAYTYDSADPGRAHEAVMQRMMELESAWSTLGLESRPRVIVREGGEKVLLSQAVPFPTEGETNRKVYTYVKKAIEKDMWKLNKAGERVDKEEFQFLHIDLELLPQYEAEGWSLWQPAKRPTVPPFDKDEREIDFVQDVLEDDEPLADTPYLFPTGMRLAWLPSLQPGEDASPEALTKKSPRSHATTSHTQESKEPAESVFIHDPTTPRFQSLPERIVTQNTHAFGNMGSPAADHSSGRQRSRWQSRSRLAEVRLRPRGLKHFNSDGFGFLSALWLMASRL